MLTTIVSIQPKDSSGSGGETRESVVYRLADEMLEKLPADFLDHEVNKRMVGARRGESTHFRGSLPIFFTSSTRLHFTRFRHFGREISELRKTRREQSWPSF